MPIVRRYAALRILSYPVYGILSSESMRYVECRPSPQLRHVVDRYWYLEGRVDGPDRIYPDGYCEVAIDLGPAVPGQSPSLWIPQLVEPVDMEPGSEIRVFGARLRPEAAMLAAPLCSGIVDLEGVWQGVPALRERLGEARSTDSRVAVMDRYLAAKLADRPPNPCVAESVRLLGEWAWKMDALASRVGVSARQLQRLFQKHVGLEPHTFARLARFQRALQLERATEFSWTRIAQEAGYFDQAHLIGEFRQFTGATPAARQDGEMGRHMSRGELAE